MRPIHLALLAVASLIASGCQPPASTAPGPQAGKATGGPPAPPAPPAPPPAAAPPTPAVLPAVPPAPPPAVTAATAQDDPVELARLALEAHREKVRLIASVHDLDSAQAVSGTFPAADTRHRLLEQRLLNRLLTEDARQQLELLKPQQDELRDDYAREYVRVAFIPGAWEHMHPELAPLADLTEIPEDAAGLEREAARMLTQSLELMRQVTNANQALELSPRYRVATARIGPVLARLNTARGGSGARENQPPQIQELRRQCDAERKRIFSTIQGGSAALAHGERPGAAGGEVAAGPGQPATNQIIQALRSQDARQVHDALGRLTGERPGADRAVIGAELIRLLDFEPVRGNTVEAIKHGWFAAEQIPQIREAMAKTDDRGYRYSMAEGIGRVPDLDSETIEFLATLFNESPGDAARALRGVGPPAQAFVQPYAASPKAEVRKTVCELLRDIGTADSLPLLQKLTQDSDRGVSQVAHEAIREIAKPASERPHLRDR